MINTFKRWAEQHESQKAKQMPESDRLLHIIIAAGTQGVRRDDLNDVELDRQVVDDLLNSLATTGLISITNQNGVAVLRSALGSPTAP